MNIAIIIFLFFCFSGLFLAWWRKKYCADHPLSFQDGIQVLFLLVAAFSVALIFWQVEKNTQANIASVRGQLYAKESELTKSEFQDDDEGEGSVMLSSIYAEPPLDASPEQYILERLSMLEVSEEIKKAKTVEQLANELFGIDAARSRNAQNKKIRKLFLHIQDIFYHMHNAYDYKESKVLTEEEWKTWNGYIREIGPHPLLLAVIWQGHKYDYFSEAFGDFIRNELIVPNKEDTAGEKSIKERNKKVISFYYSEMLKESWAKPLPDY